MGKVIRIEVPDKKSSWYEIDVAKYVRTIKAAPRISRALRRMGFPSLWLSVHDYLVSEGLHGVPRIFTGDVNHVYVEFAVTGANIQQFSAVTNLVSLSIDCDPNQTSGSVDEYRRAALKAMWRIKDGDLRVTLSLEVVSAKGCRIAPGDAPTPTIFGKRAKLSPECQAILKDLGGEIEGGGDNAPF